MPINPSFKNNSREIPFNTIGIYPAYMRFEPYNSNDEWNVDRVYVNVRSSIGIPTGGLDFDGNTLNEINEINDDNIWLGEDSGLFINLSLGVSFLKKSNIFIA